jgi:hypothetical protein
MHYRTPWRIRRERCSERNKGERFFIILLHIFLPPLPHFSKHLFSYFISHFFPLHHFSLIRSQYIKSYIPVQKKISVSSNLYKCVCFHSRQAAAETSVWILAAACSVVTRLAKGLTSLSHPRSQKKRV